MAKIPDRERAALVCELNIHEKLECSGNGMNNAMSRHITTEHSRSVSGSDGTKQSGFSFIYVIKVFSHVPL